ncbi:PD-(D/E)XK motif protein [Mameliella sp. AT18]|uniref:PD-(D/E)XK motif protein n=1 Tax=Mameliella sp. AT18 TaxID=3028385 RepID=UPI00237BB05B|nr:PD-(D/E)XK motif protein [Mameliella sp. AT18]MDD9732311.1 PD-(D/E)XK motif protein [Mameliella sp. AT18]
MNPDELVELWRSLAEGQGTSGMDRRRLDTEAAVDLFACIFWPSGRLGLLIEGDGEQRPPTDRIPTCRGVKVLHEVLDPANPRTVLRVMLEDDRLREIFAVLSADLVNAVGAERNTTAGLRRCIDRLSMWQGLFERVPAEGLSQEAQRGLFGELIILESLCLAHMEAYEAVTSWSGPSASHQDFTVGDAAIEVKTTLSKLHARLAIANERQLDERSHRALLLAHVCLEESSARGIALPALVARIRSQLQSDHTAAREFDDRLLQGGYLEVHAPLYAMSRYRVTDLHYFHVCGNFPRLTEANLPSGVGDIRYTIIAGDLSEYAIPRERAVQLLMGPND